jgi:hypothetical protein
MSISSGRFTAEIAQSAIKSGEVRRDISPTSSEVNFQEIIYKKDVSHKMSNCENPHQERQEIKYY